MWHQLDQKYYIYFWYTYYTTLSMFRVVGLIAGHLWLIWMPQGPKIQGKLASKEDTVTLIQVSWTILCTLKTTPSFSKLLPVCGPMSEITFKTALYQQY